MADWGESLRKVAAALLSETVLYAWPSPAEAKRIALPYSVLMLISDRGIGQPHIHRLDLGDDTEDDPDVRKTIRQLREATVRLHCYGAGAATRARTVATGYASTSSMALWGTSVLVSDGRVIDATRTIGSHHEEVAVCDFIVRYTFTHSEDLYSIQTVHAGVTTT